MYGKWQQVGTIGKREMQSVDDPVSKLHKKLKQFHPEGTNIMEFGLGDAALEYFTTQVEKAVDKQYPHLPKKRKQSVVAVTLLNAEPCKVPEATGFEVFIREIK